MPATKKLLSPQIAMKAKGKKQDKRKLRKQRHFFCFNLKSSGKQRKPIKLSPLCCS
jgi:hypothetical protein